MQNYNWNQSVTLRSHQEQDLPFMQELYASTREDELKQTDFTEDEKRVFLTQQFNAQYTHYTQHYATDAFNIIELHGQAIGRLFVDYWTTEIRVVDIALKPEYCNRGIGSYLFKNLCDEASATGRTVTIHVEHNNPAKNLYQRLGFTEKTRTNEIYILMEWRQKTQLDV